MCVHPRNTRYKDLLNIFIINIFSFVVVIFKNINKYVNITKEVVKSERPRLNHYLIKTSIVNIYL